ncbi:MAG: hypothetical protein GY950_29600 [bacterium]|nr:hypothetical protein [bacterium]
MARRRRYGYDGYSDFPAYISVGEKRAKAEKSLAKLKKKNPHVKPVIIEGTTISSSWWGKSWNKNLEGYADYSNRIGRGRSYLRTGAVLDLQIVPGEITALVQGSRARPYSVTIQITEIAPAAWKELKKACAGKLDSLPELLAGKFPKALGELFTERGKGLFPSPREIYFSCSCPDDAVMCKHVAAALYGVSARLDTEPGLFFTLRKVKMEDLVSETVQSKSRELLKKAKKKSSRVMEDSDLSAIFGIQLDEGPGSAPKPARKPAPKKKTHTADPSSVDVVENYIRKSKEGVDTTELKFNTGLDIKEIRGILAGLKRAGKIKTLAGNFYTIA